MGLVLCFWESQRRVMRAWSINAEATSFAVPLSGLYLGAAGVRPDKQWALATALEDKDLRT